MSSETEEPREDVAMVGGGVANLLLVVVSVVLCLVLMEVGLRTYQRMATGTPFLSFLPDFRHTAFQRSPFLVFGPRVDWTVEQGDNPDWTRFNDLGIRVAGPVPEKEDGEFRVLALGGSTTENVWNDLGIHWPLAMECRLRQEGRENIRILNAGMSAYSTAHSLVRFQLDLVEVEPDAVLVLHNINDLTVVYDAALAGVEVDPNYAAKYAKKSYTSYLQEDDIVVSRLARLIRGRLAGLAAGSRGDLPDVPEADVDRGVEIFQRNLTALVRAIRGSGAIPVLLTMPRSADEGWIGRMRAGVGQAGISSLPADAQRAFRDFDRYNQAVREVAGAEGAELIDQAAASVWTEEHFVDLVHYSTEGIRAFGREAALQAVPFLPEAGAPPLGSRVSCDGVY